MIKSNGDYILFHEVVIQSNRVTWLHRHQQWGLTSSISSTGLLILRNIWRPPQGPGINEVHCEIILSLSKLDIPPQGRGKPYQPWVPKEFYALLGSPGSVCHTGDEQDMGRGTQTDPEGIKCIACSPLSEQRSSVAHHSEQVSHFLQEERHFLIQSSGSIAQART